MRMSLSKHIAIQTVQAHLLEEEEEEEKKRKKNEKGI